MKWTYNKDTGIIKDENGYEIAQVTLNGDSTHINGLLIASAPELLKALEEIKDCYLPGKCDLDVLGLAKDAISKAKGEPHA